MSDPFLGEIKMWAFPWAPSGWAFCDGANLPVNQNQALYSLLGVTFGGTAGQNFNLPDLRGRTPLGTGAGGSVGTYNMGNTGGLEAVALTVATVPPHTHEVVGYSTAATTQSPTGNMLANVNSATSGSTTNFSTFLPGGNWTANAVLNAGTIDSAGGGTPHNNMQPFGVTNFTICQSGSYPPRN
ncbi:phage tail protein [Sphingomonas suaedae]|uniref:Phage tail protein n=1 Tax=Sphingomonas suaedae TaxID=2599297 RepID=A0A518RCM3_9SPHN|nr:tail fiber protein [Sphingomonas suaedae]QDX25131.1 phage tail protein [Sphingomonas suaedae]